jgi:capsule biosynthesis phosphatase
MSNHIQTIVVDFDDTLALTLNRDWEHAQPNQPLIDKLNNLYDSGWDIHIVTARGQLSCKGDCNAADLKYRGQITAWLNNNGVKFTSLSFQKKLAAYYIDDKGIHPDDFLTKFQQDVLKGGMSGASVVYDHAQNAVFKTAPNTHSAVEWYKHAENLGYRVPYIHSVVGETIKMEKLFPLSADFNKVLDLCGSFKNHKPIHGGLLPDKYIERCTARIKHLLSKDELQLTTDILEYAVYHTPSSFSHGDFSISNIMSAKEKDSIVLIDPINDPTLLSSWIIDLAKLYMSIEFEYCEDDVRLHQILNYVENMDINGDAFKAHAIGHYCRVIPYEQTGYAELILKRKLNVFRQKINS